jgi:hypothetical protein
MSLSKRDFLDLMATGDYYARQRRDDHSRVDISIVREDGIPAGIPNYPYRTNQMPAYIFDAFLREGVLIEDGKDGSGASIYRAAVKVRKIKPNAA